MDFGTHNNIEVRAGTTATSYVTDLWGPYSFDFEDQIPSGDTLSAITLKAFAGKVKPTSDLSAATDITTQVIDPAFTPIVNGDYGVRVKFQYPTVGTYKNTKATIVFFITTVALAKKSFYFHSLVIK